jgi:hypothetical protein
VKILTETPSGDQLPPPLPGQEAAERRALNPIPPSDGSEPSQLRQVAKSVLIGLVGVAVSMAIPVLIVVVLAFLAQIIITGH